MAGGAFGDLADDTYHVTGDLLVATQTKVLGDHWIKGGILYDKQDRFSKVGPELGLLLVAESRHPISVDFAYGIGQGDPVFDVDAFTLTAVADNNVQLRVGTVLGPHVQVGVTGTQYSWDNDRFEDVSGYGGFATLNFGDMQLAFDVTTDDPGTRGFANVAMTTGGWSVRGRHRDSPLRTVPSEAHGLVRLSR